MLCTHNLAEAETLADRIAIIRRGRIIALGTPAELKTQLLGAPLMELRLAVEVDGVGRLLSDLIDVEAQGDNWVRYYADHPTETNPALLRRLAAHDVGVVTLSEVQRSLEDVYLRVVEE